MERGEWRATRSALIIHSRASRHTITDLQRSFVLARRCKGLTPRAETAANPQRTRR